MDGIDKYLSLGVINELEENLGKRCPDNNVPAFFELVSKGIEFFIYNQYNNYEGIKQYFTKSDLVGDYRSLYFIGVNDGILEYYTNVDLDAKVLEKSHKIVENEAKIELVAPPHYAKTIKNGFDYNFYKLRKHLDTYPDNQNRIKTISDLKDKCLQLIPGSHRLFGEKYQKFVNECDVELKGLYEIERNSPSSKVANPVLGHERNGFNSMPLDKVKDHFNELATTKSKNGNPLLSKPDLDRFIDAAFGNGKLDTKLTINFAKGSEQGKVISIFHKFYYKSKDSETTTHTKDKYIHLLFDHFDNFDLKTLKDNFRS